MKHYHRNQSREKHLKELYKDADATHEYWNEDWGGRDFETMRKSWLYNHTFARSVDVFVEQSDLKAEMKVLDVGCGWGRLSIGLLRRLPKLKIVGIDISEIGVEQAKDTVKRECGEVDFEGIVTSADDLPFDDCSFDAVVSSRVFQYLSDPQSAFDEVFRVLRPGGRATVMAPNKRNPWHIFRYHTKLMTVRELADMAKQSGLQLEATGTLLFFPPRVFRFDENSIAVKIERMLSSVPIINKIGGLAMVCVSKSDDFKGE